MNQNLNKIINRFRFVIIVVIIALFIPGSSSLHKGMAGKNCYEVYNIEDFGAVGDGKTLNTASIQDAVDYCAKAGGGMVYIPSGDFVTGPIFLKSNINFHISEGAMLLGDTNKSRYPGIQGRWEGIERKTYASILTGHDLENISITGRGTIDARGRVWWNAFMKTWQIREKHGIKEREPDNPPEAPLKWPRPRVINLFNCKDVLIRDITIKNSPSWTVHPVYCTNVTVDNVTVFNPDDSPNTDGINFDSSKDSKIVNCYIDVGDDCITLKSGYNKDGRRVGIPCENIVIANCIMVHGHGGVVIGSEMSGDVRNVAISNCVFDQTNRGLRFKTVRGRGGVVENIRASNIVMGSIGTAFTFSMFYQDWRGALTLDGFYHGDKVKTNPVTEETPVFRNIHFSDISVSNANVVAEIRGLPEMPVQNISFSNINVISSDEGMMIENAYRMLLDNVIVNANTYPIGPELEYIPEVEEIPKLKAIHIRRKYRVGKDIIPMGNELGSYEIKIHIENVGTFPLKNMSLKDKIPDSFERSDFSLEPQITDLKGEDILQWDIESIDEGELLEITYNIKGTGEYNASEAQETF